MMKGMTWTTSYRVIKILFASLIVLLVFSSMGEYAPHVYSQNEANATPAVTDPVMTFIISLGVGILGASAYLFILLMTDRTLSILENQMLDLRIMVILYTVLGGIVAAVIQTSIGSGISATNVQNVFMLGFGWQGAMSGAGGSSKVGELKDNANEFKKLLEDLTPEGET